MGQGKSEAQGVRPDRLNLCLVASDRVDFVIWNVETHAANPACTACAVLYRNRTEPEWLSVALSIIVFFGLAQGKPSKLSRRASKLGAASSAASEKFFLSANYTSHNHDVRQNTNNPVTSKTDTSGSQTKTFRCARILQ